MTNIRTKRNTKDHSLTQAVGQVMLPLVAAEGHSVLLGTHWP